MLGDNIMIEGIQIWTPPSQLLIDLGLASPYRPDDFPEPAPKFRMFLDDRDVSKHTSECKMQLYNYRHKH